MPVDLVIRNGTVVTGDETFAAGIAIDKGRIVAVATENYLPPALKDLDAGGMYVMPGLIDAHVHFRTPGLEHKEDLTTGSIGAAVGGVTCVLDMPNTVPLTASSAIVALRQRLIAESSYVDVMLVGVLIPDNGGEIVPMAESGVVGYKVYLGESVGGIATPDDGQLLDYMADVANTGLRFAFHAESGPILRHAQAKVRVAGRTDGAAFAESRPVIAEVEAIHRVCLFASHTGAKIHILHLSSKDGLNAIREWRRKGVDVTAETAPQYLFLTHDDLVQQGSRLRCNPPVRTADDAAELYRGLLDGDIDMIATDHAPHTDAEKTASDIWQAMSGITGVETAAALVLSEAVNTRGMTLERFVNVSSVNPARVWGVWPRKGALVVGADADVTIVDLKRDWVIDEKTLHSKNKVSVWHGRSGRGKPVSTIIGGRPVVVNGELVAAQPSGRLVNPVRPERRDGFA
ncbi:MAG TPA: allantoinase AllB [Candidatus Limnocylindria bacterium]